jgi:hypothetical protein
MNLLMFAPLKRNPAKAYPLAALLLLSAAVRAVLAAGFGLGNDEAYYYVYALYPGLSYFDHPPMVGWVIQIFSLHLTFSSEFFIRLAAVIAGTVNTALMYAIGRLLRDERTGWYAALLYTASVYGFILAGVFILPDAPQSVFWLSALFFYLKAFLKPEDRNSGKFFLLASAFLGLAMLSKYTSAFLWAGMMAYVLIADRQWLRRPVFYGAQLLSLLLFTPVILWNLQNGLVSLLYQGGRVGPAAAEFNPDYFLTELLGEALYHNPVGVVLTGMALVWFFSVRFKPMQPALRFTVMAGLPLIVTFLLVSLFRRTLPHWSGPGYLSLLPLTAVWLSQRSEKRFPGSLKAALSFLILLLTTAVLQISTGFIPVDRLVSKHGGQGEKDISLELYGWNQLKTAFGPIAERSESDGSMPAGAPIVSYRWFPAANYSYYLSRGTERKVMAAGDTSEIHQYAWINAAEGGFRLNTDAWYITSSRDYRSPRALPGLYYNIVMTPDTVPVMRAGKPAYYFYIYRLKNLQSKR